MSVRSGDMDPRGDGAEAGTGSATPVAEAVTAPNTGGVSANPEEVISNPESVSANPEGFALSVPSADTDASAETDADAYTGAETGADTGTGAASPLPPPPYIPPPAPLKEPFWKRAFQWSRDYFVAYDPTFWSALAPFILISIILFARSPATNYIFDEQEALLANPYVNATGGLHFIDAIHRDFWGLPADRSVGSYRPLPNFLWRLLWNVSTQPFFHSIYNVLFHAVNGALLTCIVFALSRRRGMSYLAGALFVACAVLTEAVSGIVGIADVLGGMGALLALGALFLPAWIMPLGVFVSLSIGLFSKESALVCVPLIPFAALVAAPLTHPERPQRVIRALLALVAATGAFVLYVELRKRWFPSPLPSELEDVIPYDLPWTKRVVHEFLVWFHQAPLPKDPLNNPLATADTKTRIAGALRVYWRGLTQIVFPKTLSGDYSFPQEPAPDHLIFPESVAGAAMMVLPPLASLGLWITAMVRERRARREARLAGVLPSGGPKTGMRIAGLLLILISLSAAAVYVYYLAPHGITIAVKGIPVLLAAIPVGLLGGGLVAEAWEPLPRPDPERAEVPLGRSGAALVAIGLVWIVVSYFPHSNIPVTLPTVRAERFWYFPALGSSVVLAVLFAWAHRGLRGSKAAWAIPAFVTVFLGFQCVQAYRHAMDYRTDLDFWEATKNAVPRSAKAHLNYSVMVGARNNMEARLASSKMAIELAPKWPMAHIYTGDTLCRMHRAQEAWPYYVEGFEIGPNEVSLIALALQCLYDEKQLYTHEKELRDLADANPDTWLAYLATDTLKNGETNKGVDPKHRPRGYNEGPKE